MTSFPIRVIAVFCLGLLPSLVIHQSGCSLQAQSPKTPVDADKTPFDADKTPFDADKTPFDADKTPFDADDSLNRMITGLVLKHMPHSYTRDKDWGHQSERWDGIKWQRDGWRLKTKRRKKLVNHGTWRMYSARLLDPRRQFDVTVTRIHQLPDRKLAFQVNFTTRIKLHARQSEWVKGVQVYSISADGKAAVRLTVDMTLGISLDTRDFPPVLVFAPRATSANLNVSEFRIDRVSKLGGEFSQQVTRLVRRELAQEVAEKEVKLVEKINREIAEEADDLRLSLSGALGSRWTEQARPFLPPTVRQAVESGHDHPHDDPPGAPDR